MAMKINKFNVQKPNITNFVKPPDTADFFSEGTDFDNSNMKYRFKLSSEDLFYDL